MRNCSMPKKRKNRKDAGKEEESPGGEEQTRKKIRFHVAFLVLIGSFAVLTLVSLILVLFLGFFLSSFVLGVILVLILVPLLSGFIAGRYIVKRDTWLLGIRGGIVWSIMEISVIFIGLFSIKTVMPVKLFGTLEILILVSLLVANVVFCLLGLRISAKPNALLQIKQATGD